MNTGIIHNALTLTRTLALELEYRESSVFREIETEPEWPTEVQRSGDCLKMSLHASLSVIERVGGVGNKNASRRLSTCEGQNPIDL
jgi:hypothetical protein